MNKNIKQDYQKKIDELKKHNKFYYENSSPVISDKEYDKLKRQILDLEKECLEKDIFIIGGPDIIVQTFDLFKEFYLTRIYGNFKCDKFININKIADKMNLIEKIDCDDTCHFEIWRK